MSGKWIIEVCRGDMTQENEQKDFFQLYGTELVSIGGWLGDAKFTVEELFKAFKARLESEK